MKRLVPDTLFVRLFLLLFVMLTVSQFISLEVFFNFFRPPPPPLPLRPHPPGGPRLAGMHEFRLIEFVLRLAAIALTSWIAARWLSLPIRRLAQAASELGGNLDHPRLDETSGPSEVRKASVVFNQMQARIRQQITERNRFLAAVSHDLRTPLTRLRLRVEKLDAPLKTDIRRDLDEMATMIDATLDYLRGDWQPEAARLLDVEALVHSLAENATEQGENVSVSGNAKPIAVQPLALQRCLNNLVENAIRYGNRADIRLDDGGDGLSIAIHDTGPGIPEHQLEAVFAPFHRLEASRSRHTGGVGLGLSIARDIAHKLGGTLTLKNAPEGGLVATLTLPRKDADA